MNNVLEIIETESYDTEILKVILGDIRLNAEYYAHENNFYLSDTLKTEQLSKLADVFGFGPFKRFYIDEAKYGIPLISSSEMMEIEPNCNKYISRELTNYIDKYVVQRNTVLISCSGSIGNVTLVDSRLEGMAISQHALRVILNDNDLVGYIYTFFNSEFGQSLVTGKKSGAVIKEIYDDDLKSLEIPLIDKDEIVKINELILKAFEKREIAKNLLNKARQLVLEYNHMPPLDEVQLETLDMEKETDLRQVSTKEFTNDFRLDAHFYNPTAELAVGNILEFASNFDSLSNITSKVFYLNRFKRTFVNEKHGFPYLAGKDIIKIRPNDISYLSESETSNMDDYRLEKEWILLTCSGTIGRTCYIWKNYEDWVGTHDLIRIASNGKMDSGYLYAFLSCDYGYHQILRHKHGAVIDHITPEHIEKIIIPIPEENRIIEIGDLVRQAYDLRAEAIHLEDEAQDILTVALTGK
jgi:type I restriction enzyme S subunit